MSTHTLLKSSRKAEADHIMQIAVACWDVRGIRKETKRGNRGARGGEKAGGGRGRAKERDLEVATTFFKGFCVLDPHQLLFTLARLR